jgi:hypothetical protein
MKRPWTAVLSAALLAGTGSFVRAEYAPFGRGVTLVSKDKLDLSMYGRGQMLGVYENVPDHIRDHNRVYLFMKEARLGWTGSYTDLMRFEVELAYGGEDANGSNTDLSLMNFVADIPIRKLGENAVFKIGQFRVPYSREGLGDEGFQNFAERSIANLATYQGRDYGIALMGTKGVWTGTLGTFSSGGRDVPQRYLPEQLGFPEVVARFGYNDGVDEDLYHVAGTDRDLKRTTKAFMFNGLYEQDTQIGHSTAINAKTSDKNLLIDPQFNPYINQGGPGQGQSIGTAASLQRGNLWIVGGDAVVRHPLGGGRAVEGEAEANYGGYQNRFGVIHIASARAQGDYQFGPWEVGARYALLSMDKKAGFVSSSATGPSTTAGPIKQSVSEGMGRPIHEITPSITYHFKGHRLKIVADAPIYLNCPIWYDNADGAYAMPDATSVDQGSVLATPGNNTVRRTVVEGRMLFQFQF